MIKDIPSIVRPYPRPRPIINQPTDIATSGLATNTEQSATIGQVVHSSVPGSMRLNESDSATTTHLANSGITPTIEPEEHDPDQENDPAGWVDEPDPSTPPRRRKRHSIHISPISSRLTQTKQRRKITDDDLAAIEAQKLGVGTRRIRRIRRRS